MLCRLCPHDCGVDRGKVRGFCGAYALPRIALSGLFAYEEPCISGERGAGAVFFSACNLRCIFCQNHVLQDGCLGKPMDAEALMELFLSLQQAGAHNIDLVTPTPHVETLIPALRLAKQNGLAIPVVYNSNAYEQVSTIERLNGLVDVYLPDFKYIDPRLSERFSNAADYGKVAIAAIDAMYKQVGALCVDENGLAVRGVLIRHLILPSCLYDSRAVLDAINAHWGSEQWLSLMRQYTPLPEMHKPPLDRRLTGREYRAVLEYCLSLGFTNVYTQEAASATLNYTPDFGV